MNTNRIFKLSLNKAWFLIERVWHLQKNFGLSHYGLVLRCRRAVGDDGAEKEERSGCHFQVQYRG